MLVNVFFKTSIRNKLQHNAIVLWFKNHRIQSDDIVMVQRMCLCFIFQVASRSANNNSKTTINNALLLLLLLLLMHETGVHVTYIISTHVYADLDAWRHEQYSVSPFLPCDALRCTVFVIVILSVCPSVCLSHSCTVSTWFDLRSSFLHHMVAPSF